MLVLVSDNLITGAAMSLTLMQSNFVTSIVYDGVSGSEAARRAGYSTVSARQTASQLLSQTNIQNAIRNEQFKFLNGHLASKALKALAAVIDDPEAPHGAKVQASIAVLERSGLHFNTVQQDLLINKPLSEMSLQELDLVVKNSKAKLSDLSHSQKK